MYEQEAEEKYQWKVTVGFEEVDDKDGFCFDGGVLEIELFDTIDDAMDYIERCVTQNNEKPVDLASNGYLWKRRPSVDSEETRIKTKYTGGWRQHNSVDYITYIIERVERKK